VDPGYEQSAVVCLSLTGTVIRHDLLPNESLLAWLRTAAPLADGPLVLEQIEHYGMPVGREVLETVFFSGRCVEAWWPHHTERLPRRTVKVHLCHSSRATDANVRQALIDRYGPTTAQAIGTKKAPGPLYRITSHQWAALALAVTFLDTRGAPVAVDVF
jgi:hypothetical protein